VTAEVSVLVVSADERAVRLVTSVAQDGGDRVETVADAEAGVNALSAKQNDAVFIDLSRDAKAGLALIAHAQVNVPDGAICALVPESEIQLVSEALSLGATAFVLMPLTGDGVERILNDVRAKVLLRRDRLRFQDELERARRRIELVDRLVRLAIGAGQSEAVRAIAEVLKDASGAKGIALYATFVAARGECIRLALIGMQEDFPSVCGAQELSQAASRANASMVPLEGTRGTIGFAILEGRAPGRDDEIKKTCELVAAVLSFVDGQRNTGTREAAPGARGRTHTLAYFEDVARRETKKALRHGRRLSVGVVVAPSGKNARRAVEDALLPLLRETDVLAAFDEDRLCLLLPETSGIGAHAARRRILARLAGDRRGRSEIDDAPPPLDVAMGLATYPHDGASIERLLRVARARAEDDRRSSVHVLSLAKQSLAQIVGSLLARPMLDAGSRSLYPLDLASPALLSVVLSACNEARRGGGAHVTVTLQPGLGLAAAARQLAASDPQNAQVEVFDVREREGCSDIEAIAIVAEHSSWVCCGRVERDRFFGIHAADPLLCDVIRRRLVEEGGVRAG
jgi:AmiR/NasT family two-component response regulator